MIDWANDMKRDHNDCWYVTEPISTTTRRNLHDDDPGGDSSSPCSESSFDTPPYTTSSALECECDVENGFVDNT